MVDLMQAQQVVSEVCQMAAIETEDDHRVYPGTMGGTPFIFVRVPGQPPDQPETTITFANTPRATVEDLRDRVVAGLGAHL